MFELDERVDGDTVVFVLSGEIDAMVAYRIADAAEQRLDEQPGATALVVDASGVTFCDSTGLGALVRARRAAGDHGMSFSLRGAHGTLLKVLEVTGLTQELGVEPTA